MKNLFKKHRSNSVFINKQEEVQNDKRRLSLPNIRTPQFEILHSEDCPLESDGEEEEEERQQQEEEEGIIPEDAESIALSETNTLMVEPGHRSELQPTYTDNFTLYLPFILRQMRLVEQQRMVQLEDLLHPRMHAFGFPIHEYDQDDMSTIVNEFLDEPEHHHGHHRHTQILNKSLNKYNLKRSFVFVELILGNTMYIFPGQQSFQLFKRLRHDVKRERKNSIIVYDSKGTIKRISHGKREDVNLQDIIDDRPHIIPIEYKIKGLGLPLLKMQNPVMSSFRKNVPYAVFRKFREIPLPPDPTSEKHDDFEFESFVVCKVYSKFFPNFRRLIFEFNFPGTPPFNVLMFQSNLRSFADFNYKSTRFRIIGVTPAQALLSSYNPHLRLLILDNDQQSLCDDIINKKQGFKLSKLNKRKPDPVSPFEESDPGSYINPFPTNTLAREDLSDTLMSPTRTRYISNNLPPFGECKDSILYKIDESSLFPKKFSETGKLDIYQDNENLMHDLDSTLSVNIDSVAICCIIATIRDISIKNSGKISKVSIAPIGITGRTIGLGYTGYVFG